MTVIPGICAHLACASCDTHTQAPRSAQRAFASFVGKLDLVVEKGKIKENTYALLDVDPERSLGTAATDLSVAGLELAKVMQCVSGGGS